MKFESGEALLDKVKIDVKPFSLEKIGFNYAEEHPDKFITRLMVVFEDDNTYVEIYGYDIEEDKKQFWNSFSSDERLRRNNETD